MSKEINYSKKPQIYVYSSPNQPGLKVGYTERVAKSGSDFDAVKERIEEGLVKTPNAQYKIEYYTPAITKSGQFFKDHLVHKWLKNFNVEQIAGEWYDTTVGKVIAVIDGIKNETPESSNLKKTFPPRPEQERFLNETMAYFDKMKDDPEPIRYLWNAKMRFGKTFTAYQLAKRMGWNRILVLTYKPGVENEWKTDLYSHKDFDGWQFIEGLSSWDEKDIDENRPVVWFASYQDVLGKGASGELKERHRKMREIDWDCIYVDEYHFGAWRDAAKEFGQDDKKDEVSAPDDYDEAGEIEGTLPIKTRGYLYLSGTPFRALVEGEFTEDQISNWTYADEQRAKNNWSINDGPNPYESLPQIVMMTYKMPESLRKIAMQGELDEFDLNTFFKTKKLDDGRIVFEKESYVQKFLNILHGVDLEVEVENRAEFRAPALPFEDSRLLSVLRHTFWFLPSVPACKAMEDMLKRDPFFSAYKIIRAAGNDTPGGKEAKEPVVREIKSGIDTMTITLSCGKLTTGVTIPAWSGVLFLRNTEMPETYFQTAFRAQSPWTLQDADDPMKTLVMKPVCYLLDFAPTRALRLMADYSDKLSVGDKRRPEERLDEFIKFLPVLCYDGISMQRLKSTEILDISTYGTASTMLARKWQSARLIDTTTVVLEKILNNEDVLQALEKVEDFRNLRGDLSKTINREKALKKAKKERNEEGREATPEEKKVETEQEKENRSFKKKLRERLLKFVARVPVFMYLTDYREEALVDVIRNLEPELFTKVTGLTIHEFDQLCEIGAFNQTELNMAIAQFRRFEDASLEYAGGRSAHEGDEMIGLFDTKVTRDEADEIIEAEVA
jgi:hypothetical protein